MKQIKLWLFLVPILAGFMMLGAKVFSATPAKRVKINIFQPGGAYHPDKIVAKEKSLGIRFHGVMWYSDWSENIDVGVVRSLDSHGWFPICTWEVKHDAVPVMCQEIIEGKHNTYIRSNAIALRDAKIKMRITQFAEMNGDWSPSYAGKGSNTPSLHQQAWSHIVKIFREAGATNVTFGWSPNVRYGGDRFRLAELYPGNQWVDVAGMDGYNWGNGEPHEWQSFRQVFDATYQELCKISNKPIVISEMACVEGRGGNKAMWTKQMFTDLLKYFPRITEITWFNEQKERDWRIDSSPEAKKAFQLGAK
jgi:mannan endo-1,4-beta-mannosidase